MPQDPLKLDVNLKRSSAELSIWSTFANAPGDECRRLYAEMTKLMIARAFIDPPRPPRKRDRSRAAAAIAEPGEVSHG